MDKRIYKTKQGIYQAFYQLLAKKSYAKITIQDIIETANIGRSTFYIHFATKDELLKAICSELFEHIFCLTPQREASHDFSNLYGQIDLLIIHILYHLKDDEKKLKLLLRYESSELFWHDMKEQFNILITDYMLHHTIKKPINIPESLLIAHISNSFISLCKWWIQNNMQTSPEELEGYFETLLFALSPVNV